MPGLNSICAKFLLHIQTSGNVSADPTPAAAAKHKRMTDMRQLQQSPGWQTLVAEAEKDIAGLTESLVTSFGMEIHRADAIRGQIKALRQMIAKPGIVAPIATGGTDQ